MSNLQDVRQRVDQEGFDYAFLHYSDFKEAKDKEFHKLRVAYVNAHEDLETYLNENSEGEE